MWFNKSKNITDISCACLSSDVVDTFHLLRIMRNVADGQMGVGAYHEAPARQLCPPHIVELCVVHRVTSCHGLGHLRISPHPHAHERHHSHRAFDVTVGLGQYHHIPFIPDAFEIFERYRVGHAAVEQFASVDVHHPRYYRHRCRCAYPFEESVAAVVASFVYGPSRQCIGAYEIILHRVVPEGLVVEDVVLRRHHMIGEFCVEYVARLQ